jgi:hypothetical protein
MRRDALDVERGARRHRGSRALRSGQLQVGAGRGRLRAAEGLADDAAGRGDRSDRGGRFEKGAAVERGGQVVTLDPAGQVGVEEHPRLAGLERLRDAAGRGCGSVRQFRGGGDAQGAQQDQQRDQADDHERQDGEKSQCGRGGGGPVGERRGRGDNAEHEEHAAGDARPTYADHAGDDRQTGHHGDDAADEQRLVRGAER